MNKSLYAIILNWNNYTDTRECIESLLRSSYSPTRIVLVDNGSSDGSIEQLQRDYTRDARVHIIRNKANYGFACGVNIGIRYALDQGAELVFLINNDATVDQNCIQVLIESVERDDDAGIAGPRIFYYADPERIWQGGGRFSLLKTGVVDYEKNKLAISCSEETREVTFLTGCAMLIKREVFEKIGLFDEDYFFYEEDVDFCLRAKRAGFKLLYVPKAKAWHKIKNIAKDRTSPFVLYHLARSRILNLRKNFSTPYFLYGLFIHLLLYTPFRFLQVIQGSRSLKSVWAWLRGTWSGLRHPLGRSSFNRSGSPL